MGSQSVRVVTHADEQCSLVNQEYCDQYVPYAAQCHCEY